MQDSKTSQMWTQLCVWLLAITAFYGCSESPQEIINALRQGPGTPAPQILGVGEGQVFYELAIEDSADPISSTPPQVTVRGVSFEDKSMETVLAFVPEGARQIQVTDTHVAWVGSGRTTVELLDRATDTVRNVLETEDGFVDDLKLTLSRLVIMTSSLPFSAGASELIFFEDLGLLQETRTLAFQNLSSFDVHGDFLVVEQHASDFLSSDIILINLQTNEQLPLISDQIVFSGPFISDQFVVWGQIQNVVELFLDEGAPVIAYSIATGEQRVVTRLGEGKISELEALLRGEPLPNDSVRGLGRNFVLTTRTRRVGERINDQVNLHDLNTGEVKRIGDFSSAKETIFNSIHENQVALFETFAVWYNGRSNRLVMYELDSGIKKKVKP